MCGIIFSIVNLITLGILILESTKFYTNFFYLLDYKIAVTYSLHPNM